MDASASFGARMRAELHAPPLNLRPRLKSNARSFPSQVSIGGPLAATSMADGTVTALNRYNAILLSRRTHRWRSISDEKNIRRSLFFHMGWVGWEGWVGGWVG